MNKAVFFSIFLAGILCIFSSCKKEKSECLTCPPPPLDTTSHAIQWQTPDTLGTQGLIRDVWVFEVNNAWVVGEIHTAQTDKVDSLGNWVTPYNAAHWDGSKWTSLKIQFYTICGQADIYAYPAYAIWAFSPTDIMIASNSQIARMNGVTQIGTACLPVSVNKIWGFNSNAVYTAGPLGQIGFWNGSSWMKMTSNTTVDLQDIWGIDGSHIWATGTNVSDGHCVVLQCNGTSWTTIYDNATKSPNEVQAFYTVWSDHGSEIYLAGQSWIRLMNLSNGTFRTLDSLSHYEAERIRGLSANDIFQVGFGSEVMHFNGKSWYHYPEILSLNGGNAWFYSVHPTNDFVVLGGIYLTALNGFPVVIRGYR